MVVYLNQIDPDQNKCPSSWQIPPLLVISYYRHDIIYRNRTIQVYFAQTLSHDRNVRMT